MFLVGLAGSLLASALYLKTGLRARLAGARMTGRCCMTSTST